VAKGRGGEHRAKRRGRRGGEQQAKNNAAKGGVRGKKNQKWRVNEKKPSNVGADQDREGVFLSGIWLQSDGDLEAA
jgi:hypothetical protein